MLLPNYRSENQHQQQHHYHNHWHFHHSQAPPRSSWLLLPLCVCVALSLFNVYYEDLNSYFSAQSDFLSLEDDPFATVEKPENGTTRTNAAITIQSATAGDVMMMATTGTASTSAAAERDEAMNVELLDASSDAPISPKPSISSSPSSAWAPPQPSGAPKSPFAYVFLLAGCDPQDPYYLGYLYGILIAIRSLQESGSQADFVVMVQMATATTTTNSTEKSRLRLPEQAWLDQLGVRTMYLPPRGGTTDQAGAANVPAPVTAEGGAFHEAQMLKFHALHLTDYQRILYLDSDIMPVCNLDYIFDLSVVGTDGTPPYLKENLVLAWTEEPANGGFFMLQPGPGEYEALLRIVAKQRQDGSQLPYPHFDLVQGWGHAIAANDQWVARKRSGRLWDFYAAYTDQGLLYHWVKYVKKNVVIITGQNHGEWWGTDHNGTLLLEQKRDRALSNYSCLANTNLPSRQMRFAHHPAYGGNLIQDVPYGDYVHFYGPFKPWLVNEADPPVEGKIQAPSARSYWFVLLRQLNEQLSMGINFTNWTVERAKLEQTAHNRVPALKDLADRRKQEEELEAKDSSLSSTQVMIKKEVDSSQSNSSEKTDLSTSKTTSSILMTTAKSLMDNTTSMSTAAQSSANATVHPQPSGRASSPFAYVFLVAGCDPNNPFYLGYLYGVMIAIQSLQDSGSQADFVVMIQMAANATETLPQEEWLKQPGIRVMYLPQHSATTVKAAEGFAFNQAQMLKFHMLHLTEYQRVLYLDSDIMPVCNLDYIFELSVGDAPYLKENLIVAWTEEPANGGFFMLQPGHGEFEELQGVVNKQREEGSKLPYPHFDEVQGWGHVIQPNDEWIAGKRRGRLWNFYAAYSDQGLLYHWVKYVKKNVVIIAQRTGEWWGTDHNDTLVLQERRPQALSNYSCLPRGNPRSLKFAHHQAYGGNLIGNVPYGDYIHFYGPFKPWLVDQADPPVIDKMHASSARSYWFFLLRQLNEKLSMGIDFDHWTLERAKLEQTAHNRVPTLQSLVEAEKLKSGDHATRARRRQRRA